MRKYRCCSKNHTIFFLLMFLLFFFLSQAEAETFRVHTTILQPINLNVQQSETKVGINDCIALLLPDDLTFFKGVELTFKLTEDMVSWYGAVVFCIYDNISPVPEEDIIDYSGTRKYLTTLPGKLSWTVQIPLIENSDLKVSPYVSVIPYTPDAKDRILFLRLQLVMKGVPESIEAAQIPVTIKPIFTDEGKLKLSFKETGKSPASDATSVLQPYTVFIDNNKITPEEDGNILPTGTHNVSVVSDYYRNEIRTVQIDQAKTTALEIPLRDAAPTVIITAPSNASVLFDGKQVKTLNEEFSVTEGAHTVHFVIGDYEIEKKITASAGHSYKVSCVIDASVTEIE